MLAAYLEIGVKRPSQPFDSAHLLLEPEQTGRDIFSSFHFSHIVLVKQPATSNHQRADKIRT